MMTRLRWRCSLLVLALPLISSLAWVSSTGITTRSTSSGLRMTTTGDDDYITTPSNDSQRRCLLVTSSQHFLLLGGASLLLPTTATAVERAVGSSEKSCREAGDCLEKGEWDAAVGWNWGGKDRCDATDPRCGPDGKLMDAPPAGEPVPQVVSEITQQVEISMSIGKSESGTIRLGLYGKDCPGSVSQMDNFLSSSGIVTTSRLMFEEGYGVSSAPVSLTNGGILNAIVPGQRLDFGVPSQAAAYAKSKGRARAGDDFVPQPRPNDQVVAQEPFVRKHDAAGLVSIPGKGLGYGGSGFESDDEAFASVFEITAGSVPTMDREGRRVIGQVLDDSSMAVVARLASLPTRKGLKGVIPGQNAGPPLLKVTVQDVAVKSV